MLLPLMVVLQACTHNDGAIGPWFGTWGMPSMTVDGAVPDGFNPATTVWEFQSDILKISLLDSHHYVDAVSWCTWREADGHLYLDYTHSIEGDAQYDAPAWLLLQNKDVCDLTIVERGSRRMVLSYTAPDGSTVVYTLKKTW